MKRFIIDVLRKMFCHCCVDGMDHGDGIVAIVCQSAMIVITWTVNLRAHACIPFLSKYWHRNDKIVVKTKESSFEVYFISLKAM